MTDTTTGTTEQKASADPARPFGLPRRWARTATAAVLALAAFPFLAEAWFVLTASRATLVGTMPDDAFYYLEIGQRVARGEGFTFDGVNHTSGFHPLWQWMVSAVELVVPGETGQIRAVRLLGLVVVAVAFAITTRVLWRSFGPLPALGGLLVASHSVAALRYLSGGMESPVVLLGLALSFAALTAYHRRPDRRAALFVGLAGAVLVLARLDMVVMLPVAAASVALRRPRLRNLSGWALGTAAVGVPYLVAHLLWHGSVATTSARVKQLWMDDHINTLGGWFSQAHRAELFEELRQYVDAIVRNLRDGPWPLLGVIGFVAVATLALAGAAGGVARLRSTGGRPGPAGTAAGTTVAMVGVKVGFDLLLAPLWFLTWYAAAGQTTAAWAIGAAAGAGVGELSRRVSARAALVVTVLALFVAVPSQLDWVTSGSPPQSTWQQEIDRAADRLRADPPEGTIGAFDAGLLGYRLDGVAEVVNLDGLVNDDGYADFLATRPDRFEMARHEGVDLVANVFTRSERDGIFGCATTVYEGERSITTAGARDDRMFVLDMRTCD